METVSIYDAHIDAKKRITLRGAKYEYYNVKEYDNGCIILEPRELIRPDTISLKSLRTMDEAVQNFKANNVSASIDLTDFE